MGRHKEKYLPYDHAKDFVQSLQPAPTTRAEYVRWHTEVNPAYLPRYPRNAYDQWESWNIFLGTTNSFEKTRDRKKDDRVIHRPFWEAVRYAQSIAKEHHITTQKGWEEWHDSGMCVRDVPKRPHHVYDEFTGRGWSVWLGTKVASKVLTAKEEVAVMAICQTVGQPPNVVTVLIEGAGISALRDKWDSSLVGTPYRIYNWEKEVTPYVDRVFAHLTFDKGGRVYLVPNIHELLFELDNLMEYAIAPRLLSAQFTGGRG